MAQREKFTLAGEGQEKFFEKFGEELVDFRGHPGRITYSVVEYIPLPFLINPVFSISIVTIFSRF